MRAHTFPSFSSFDAEWAWLLAWGSKQYWSKNGQVVCDLGGIGNPGQKMDTVVYFLQILSNPGQ
jgi:hypothetical protein